MWHKDTRYKAFDKAWFERNQLTLLFLLNRSWLRYFFRQYFGINKKIPLHYKLVSIMPDHFKAHVKDNQFASSFYSYDRMSYKVYKALKFVWLSIHFWDMKIANRFFPRFNLGYDALEFNAGELVVAGTVSCGYLNFDWEFTWADIREGVSGHMSAASNVYYGEYIRIFASVYSDFDGDSNGNRFSLLQRGIMSFNTSLLEDEGINIVSAQIGIYFSDVENEYSGYPNNNLVITSHEKVTSYILENNDLTLNDYPPDQFGTTAFAEMTWDDYIKEPGYHVFELNPAGCNYIKKTSHTAFGLMVKCDMEDDEPPFLSIYPKRANYSMLIDPDVTIDVIYNEIGNYIVMIQ